MSTYDYYIITRFNLIVEKSGNAWGNSGELLCSDDWMVPRIEVFKKTCYRSICKQKGKFKYIILLDSNTPKNYIDFFKSLDRIYDIIFIEGEFKFAANIEEGHILSKYIKEDTNCDFIISTSLDSDDCIHEDYVNVVAGYLSNQDFEYIDFLNGYFYHVSSGLVMEKMFKNNQFVNLIERNVDNIKTCLYTGHSVRESRYNLPVTYIDNNKRMFITGFGVNDCMNLSIKDILPHRISNPQEVLSKFL